MVYVGGGGIGTYIYVAFGYGCIEGDLVGLPALLSQALPYNCR